jgi:hypothetical protein
MSQHDASGRCIEVGRGKKERPKTIPEIGRRRNSCRSVCESEGKGFSGERIPGFGERRSKPVHPSRNGTSGR